MPLSAPLRVPVEITLRSGSAAGERRFRQSVQLTLPATLELAGELPVAGEGEGQVRFSLPTYGEAAADAAGEREISGFARLRFDPEHPERGCHAELGSPSTEDIEAIVAYIETRMKS